MRNPSSRLNRAWFIGVCTGVLGVCSGACLDGLLNPDVVRAVSAFDSAACRAAEGVYVGEVNVGSVCEPFVEAVGAALQALGETESTVQGPEACEPLYCHGKFAGFLRAGVRARVQRHINTLPGGGM